MCIDCIVLVSHPFSSCHTGPLMQQIEDEIEKEVLRVWTESKSTILSAKGKGYGSVGKKA